MRKALLAVGLLLLLLAVGGGLVYVRYFHPNGPVEDGRFGGSSGVTLAGSMFRPEGAGRTPAVVILHGSGTETHDAIAFRLHANAFTREGVAVLVFDKRGTGGSNGDFEAATFDDLIGDALAAVAYLRTLPDVDPDRIGLMGNSESGWFTPEIAERDGRIAFIVNRVGPATRWDDTNVYEETNELRAAGIDKASVLWAETLRRAVWAYYRDAGEANDPLEARRAELAAALEREAHAPWRRLWTMRLHPYDPVKYRAWAKDIFYDPAPYLARLKTPLLAIYGSEDKNVPTEQSLRIIDAARKGFGVPIETIVYQGYDHRLLHWSDFAWAAYPRGYLDHLGAWAKRQAARLAAGEPR